jgi:hypothetical protein
MTARDTLPVSQQVLARQHRRHRLNQANWVLAITAAHNVGALRGVGGVSRFHLRLDGRLVYLDGLTGAQLHMCPRRGPRPWTGSGTLQAFLRDLARFVRAGTPVPGRLYVHARALPGDGALGAATLRAALAPSPAVTFDAAAHRI